MRHNGNQQEHRFPFGKNWSRFLRTLDESKVAEAERSLRQMLGVETLDGKTFLDVGSGSGLFSLAARRLGARVRSFDYDPDSVACTAELKQRYFPDDSNWEVCQGSVLDGAFLGNLGKFDVVYSWGVLHHTGDLWKAIENAAMTVSANGTLFIAIYNDQGVRSRIWKAIKLTYNRLPRILQSPVAASFFVTLWAAILLRDTLRGRPFHSWSTYQSRRGMSAWHDAVDWIGGYPFEVAKPDDVVVFLRSRGFEMRLAKTVGSRLGCNEFVFENHPIRPRAGAA